MRSEHRILTTHVGSLVRPAALVDLLLRQLKGEAVDAAALEACVESSVDDIVERQAAVPVDIVSDGEFGKSVSWANYVHRRLRGIEFRSAPPAGARMAPVHFINSKDRKEFAGFYAEYEATFGMGGMSKHFSPNQAGAPVVTGPISYDPQELQADIARIKSAMANASVAHGFMPVVAPVSAAVGIADQYYSDHEAFLYAIAEALHDEYQAIVDAGLDVQIDDAYLASEYDGMVPPASLEEYRRWADVGVGALNHALRGIPEERVRYHVCWGSWNGPHTNDVNAKDIVDLILKVRAGGYSLEMANPRHEHEWRIWETTKLPEGKVLLPGVVSHATNVVEHPELVAERIVRLAKLVGRENVIASTDCGFAQGPFTRRVHQDIQWAKLSAIADGARLATEALWGRSAAD